MNEKTRQFIGEYVSFASSLKMAWLLSHITVTLTVVGMFIRVTNVGNRHFERKMRLFI